MHKRNLILTIAVLFVLVGGGGYYFWSQGLKPNTPNTNTPSENEVVSQGGGSFFDTFFDKIKPTDKPKQPGLKEYKDPAGIFSISYPPSWVMRSEQGRLLQGASFTPPELLNKYSPEEQPFVKGLVAAATESQETPEAYYKNLVVGVETGQTEAQNLTVNGYPAYLVKGDIKGVSYIIYIVSHNNRIAYFNYRTMETAAVRQDDIRKAIDFSPHVADFEAAINSIKFLK